MSEAEPSELDIEMVKPRGMRGLTIVWLVPVIALALAALMTWQSLSGRGPLIEIFFINAEGVVEDETALKFRDVTVGKVEDVRFADDLAGVIVSVRLDESIAQFVDTEAEFWIVRPEISAQGVSGLATLLGGVYLEGSWDDQPGPAKSDFEGLPHKPLFSSNEEGVEFILTAPTGGRIEAGAPIIYKGVEVGLIDRPVLTEDGSAVTASAFVRAPYHNLVTTGSRFWGASGVSVQLGTGGLEVDIGNLTSILKGGVAFETLAMDGVPIATGHQFSVFASRDDAGSATVFEVAGAEVPFSVLFDGSISGLSVGAPVEYRGLTIGNVVGLGGLVQQIDGETRVAMRADIRILPDRLGIGGDDIEQRTIALFEEHIVAGYRARLASMGLLGTSLKIELVNVPDAPAAELTTLASGRHVIPATEAQMTDVAGSLQSAAERVVDLPFEDLFNSVNDLIENAGKIVASDGVQDAPEEIVGLIEDLREVVGSEAVESAVGDAAMSLSSLQSMLEAIQQGDIAARLVATLESTEEIAARVSEASQGFPQIEDQIQALLQKANDLPLETLAQEATDLVASANALVSDPALTSAPENLSGILAQVEISATNLQTITQQVVESEAVDALLAALEKSDDVLNGIEGTITGLEPVLADLKVLSGKAATVPIEEIAQDAAALVASAKTIVADPAMTGLPDSVSRILAEVEQSAANVTQLTDTVAQSEAVDALLAALTRSEEVMRGVETAVTGLDPVLADLQTLAHTAAGLPLQDLLARATALVANIDAVAAQPETQALPGQLSDALDSLAETVANVETITTRLTDGPEIDALLAALERTDRIAGSLEDASAGLPDLVARIDAVAATAEDLPLADLVASATSLVDSAEALVSSEETAQIPPALAYALDELGAALAELREGGTVANANAMMASASEAADAVAQAAAVLPDLAERLDGLVRQAESLLATYGDRSQFNAQTLAALRDMRDAARAVTSLARTIERKPNSLLVGR